MIQGEKVSQFFIDSVLEAIVEQKGKLGADYARDCVHRRPFIGER